MKLHFFLFDQLNINYFFHFKMVSCLEFLGIKNPNENKLGIDEEVFFNI